MSPARERKAAVVGSPCPISSRVFSDRVAGFPRCGGRGPLLAVGAQDGLDRGFPGFSGGGGVDRGGGLAVEALFQQGHDFDLAAVEEPGADAVVGGHDLGGVGPAALAGQCPGAVGEQDGP